MELSSSPESAATIGHINNRIKPLAMGVISNYGSNLHDSTVAGAATTGGAGAGGKISGANQLISAANPIAMVAISSSSAKAASADGDSPAGEGDRAAMISPVISRGLARNAGISGANHARYRECLKNHAANIGGYAVDGCGEFMPCGDEGSIEALKCAACGCHRNFHRREVNGVSSPTINNSQYHGIMGNNMGLLALPGPNTTTNNNANANNNSMSSLGSPMNGGGSGSESGGEDNNIINNNNNIHGSNNNMHNNHNGQPNFPYMGNSYSPQVFSLGGGGNIHHHHHSQYVQPFLGSRAIHHHAIYTGHHPGYGSGGGGGNGGSGGGGGSGGKRFRTKFTMEQRAKMWEFSERVGWRLQKQDEAAVQQFCADAGVKRHVLKVWMHNNKNTFGKKLMKISSDGLNPSMDELPTDHHESPVVP